MKAPSESGSLQRDTIFTLMAAARLIQRDFDRRGRSHGFNRAQWQVLANLIRFEGEKQVTLAEKMDMAPIVLARIVDRLEAAGYVERRQDPEDRRARLLYLTDKARPLIQQMRVLGKETGDLAFDQFSEEEVNLLKALLVRLCGSLSDTFHQVAFAETEEEA